RLMKETRDCFQKRHADYALPISASSDGRMNYPESFLGSVDLVLLHGNGRSPQQKLQRTVELKNWERPILMTEDDNGCPSTVAHLSAELASCDAFFEHAAGWGYMPWVQAQRFPFRYLPAGPAEVRDDLPEADRHAYSEGGIGGKLCVYPMVLGHEPAGVVAKVGSGVSGWRPGDRAAFEPALYCYHCEFCMSGRHNMCENLRFLSSPGDPGFFR